MILHTHAAVVHEWIPPPSPYKHEVTVICNGKKLVRDVDYEVRDDPFSITIPYVSDAEYDNVTVTCYAHSNQLDTYRRVKRADVCWYRNPLSKRNKRW